MADIFSLERLSLTSNQKFLWILVLFSWTDITSLELKCPDQSHRPLRAKSVCFHFTSTYTCLRDTKKDACIELCSPLVDFSTLGEHYVISGNLRNIDCDEERYQPFSLWSNVSSHCMYKKSDCNDEGQTIHENGTTTEDRSCRYNYINGYSFISEPRHVSYCIPSEEDCSCFRVKCSNKHYLNSEYRCILNTLKEQNFTASHIIVNSRNEEKEIVKDLLDVLFIPKLEKNLKYGAYTFILITLVISCVFGHRIAVYVNARASSTAPDL